MVGIVNGSDTANNTLTVKKADQIAQWLGFNKGKLTPYASDMDALRWHLDNKQVGIAQVLFEYGFARVDFVYEPGQFSVRGSIIDIFSFSNEYPYRVLP